MDNLVDVDSLDDLKLDLMVTKTQGLKTFIADGFVTYLNSYSNRRTMLIDGNYMFPIMMGLKINIEFTDGACQASIFAKDGDLCMSKDTDPLRAIKKCFIKYGYGWKVNVGLLE